MPFIAYIKTFRGTGRPDRWEIREGSRISEVDPMAFHDGNYSIVGRDFETREEADAACREAWEKQTTRDSDGYTQWK